MNKFLFLNIALYERIDEQALSSEVSSNIPFLGFYMKFVLSNKFLCGNSSGVLYSSVSFFSYINKRLALKIRFTYLQFNLISGL